MLRQRLLACGIALPAARLEVGRRRRHLPTGGCSSTWSGAPIPRFEASPIGRLPIRSHHASLAHLLPQLRLPGDVRVPAQCHVVGGCAGRAWRRRRRLGRGLHTRRLEVGECRFGRRRHRFAPAPAWQQLGPLPVVLVANACAGARRPNGFGLTRSARKPASPALRCAADAPGSRLGARAFPSATARLLKTAA